MIKQGLRTRVGLNVLQAYQEATGEKEMKVIELKLKGHMKVLEAVCFFLIHIDIIPGLKDNGD